MNERGGGAGVDWKTGGEEMKLKSYFGVYEFSFILLSALASAILNTYLPIKAVTQLLGIPGPAAGMALLGGFIFVFWVALACDIVKKRYTGIVTSLLIASFCLPYISLVWSYFAPMVWRLRNYCSSFNGYSCGANSI